MPISLEHAFPQGLDRVRGFIFDCDGVLVDSKDANIAYYNRFRSSFGMPPIDAAETEFVHAASVHEALKHILPEACRAKAEEMRKTFDYTSLFPALKLEQGICELLEAIRLMGFRLAVNTNRTSTMEQLLEHFELAHFFDPVITARKVSAPKPSPEGIGMILAAWSSQPSDVIYIGDTSVDEAAARSAGVPFWAYKNPSLAADVHLAAFPDLLACLHDALASGRPQSG